MTTAIFDDLTALADATRSRMLLLLERHELTVSELCAVLQLPQSTVSRHLKTLADAAGCVAARRHQPLLHAGARRSRTRRTRRLWSLLREQVSATAGADQDARRLKGVLARRQSKSQEFFESAAGQWDRLREELFGGASHLQALPALLDERWMVGDLGCGTGQVARGARAVRGARHRGRSLRRHAAGRAPAAARSADDVEVRRGELEALPIDDAELDAATLLLVLHHLPDPARRWPRRRAC